MRYKYLCSRIFLQCLDLFEVFTVGFTCVVMNDQSPSYELVGSIQFVQS